MIVAWKLLMTGMAVALAIGVQPVHGQHFESDSNRFGDSKMGIVVREEERRPRASVLNIEVKARGSSVARHCSSCAASARSRNNAAAIATSSRSRIIPGAGRCLSGF